MENASWSHPDTLNVKGLNTSIKKAEIVRLDKKGRCNHMSSVTDIIFYSKRINKLKLRNGKDKPCKQ